jgi:hypothetical protein
MTASPYARREHPVVPNCCYQAWVLKNIAAEIIEIWVTRNALEFETIAHNASWRNVVFAISGRESFSTATGDNTRTAAGGILSEISILRQLIAGAIAPRDFEHRTGSSPDRLLMSFDAPHNLHDNIRVSIGSCHCGA